MGNLPSRRYNIALRTPILLSLPSTDSMFPLFSALFHMQNHRRRSIVVHCGIRSLGPVYHTSFISLPSPPRLFRASSRHPSFNLFIRSHLSCACFIPHSLPSSSSLSTYIEWLVLSFYFLDFRPMKVLLFSFYLSFFFFFFFTSM